MVMAHARCAGKRRSTYNEPKAEGGVLRWLVAAPAASCAGAAHTRAAWSCDSRYFGVKLYARGAGTSESVYNTVAVNGTSYKNN